MITEKFLFEDMDDDKKSNGSIGSDDAVMFVNPNNYTLETYEFEPATGGFERSAFDEPDQIEEEGLID